jgi:hypothetical protein
MATAQDQAFIVDAIKAAVRQRIAEVLAEEIKTAQERVAIVVGGEVDRIALNVMRHYRAYIERDEIHIVVSKELIKP